MGLIILLLMVLLIGCGGTQPVVSPIPPTPVPISGDMQEAVNRMIQHGYPVNFIPPEGTYVVTKMSADAIVNGSRCFFIDRVASADVVTLGATGSFYGRKCVQGYTPDFGLQIYIIEGAPATHELLHLLFWLNYPALACPGGIGLQSANIEHGGPCDPFERR